MKINTLSISGLLDLQLHSLNNEGSEGNVTQTRIVEVVDGNGDIHAVNAISGDMFKHIQSEYLHAIALKENLPLCSACKIFDVNRINASEEIAKMQVGKPSATEMCNEILRTCAIDDIEGILVTRGNMALGIKSKVEFSWVVGKPELTRTNSYFHVKFAPENPKGSGGESGQNLGQNIFHRPASSGKYAVVVHAELFRVSRNDYTLSYPVEKSDRLKRIKALLNSILYTFVKPNGAMTSFQFPHITGFSGVITTSNSFIPAPTYSALNDNFKEEIKKIARTLGDSITIYDFNSLGEFAEIMTKLANEVEPVEG